MLEATRQSKKQLLLWSFSTIQRLCARFVPTVARPNSLWNTLSLLWKSPCPVGHVSVFSLDTSCQWAS